MGNWFNNVQKHLAIWAILLVYLVAANPLYVHLFLKEGKPVSSSVSIPSQTGGITYKFGYIEPAQVKGKDLYQVRGYAFNTANPLQKYKISVVLKSSSRSLVFPTQSAQFPNMIESFSGFQKGMEPAEFSLLLAKEGLPVGIYQVGILLVNSSDGSRMFSTTGAVLKKTPNNIQFNPGS